MEGKSNNKRTPENISLESTFRQLGPIKLLTQKQSWKCIQSEVFIMSMELEDETQKQSAH